MLSCKGVSMLDAFMLDVFVSNLKHQIFKTIQLAVHWRDIIYIYNLSPEVFPFNAFSVLTHYFLPVHLT